MEPDNRVVVALHDRLRRFDANGNPDPTFGPDGDVVSLVSEPVALVRETTGKLLELGRSSHYGPGLARFTELRSTSTTSTTLPPCTSARCILDGAMQDGACGSERLPAAVAARLRRAVRIIEQIDHASVARSKRLQRRARRALAGADLEVRRAALRRRPRLAFACADAIQRATQLVGGSLPVGR